ncbi:MAG: peptidyl-alpha-hydroxyglycine alpha-amidating lyase family protein [Dehalococcoidia bacterium]
MLVGSGKLTYEVAEGWGRLPPGWVWDQVPAVAVDSRDRVHVFSRGLHPVMVFDRDGNLLTSWGEGLFDDPHGICIGPDDHIYLVDRGAHVVMKFTPEGQLLMTLGKRGQPSEGGEPFVRLGRTISPGGEPFNLPTDVALSPAGEIYVSDGYGNSRVHRFSPDGRLLLSWGTAGDGPRQFNLPHSVWIDQYGRVYVADRENHRIQLFTPEGEYLTQWTGFRQPCKIFMDAEEYIYVAELGHRVSILDRDGQLQARWGGEGKAPGQFIGSHGIWADSRGDIYVGEALQGQRVQKFVRQA